MSWKSGAPMRGKPRTLDKTILDERGKKGCVEQGRWRKRDFETSGAPALSRRLSITSNRRYPSSSLTHVHVNTRYIFRRISPLHVFALRTI